MVNLLEACYAIAALSAVGLIVAAVRKSHPTRVCAVVLAISVTVAASLAWRLGGF